MSANPHPLVGRWRITAMSQWQADDLDLVEPAFIEFARQGSGEFRFGVVVAALDCSYAQTSIDFTWHGSDEGDEVSGNGWAEIEEDGSISGEITFHNGDESTFKARRW